MRNPYSVGPYVLGNQFYGRQALVQYLLDPHRTRIYLVGNRRIGKTSLLYYLAAQTSEVAFNISLQGSGTNMRQMTIDAWRAIFRQLGNYPHYHSILQSRMVTQPEDLTALVELLGEAAELSNSNVLLLWDEAEELLEADNLELNRLRRALEAQPRLRLILAATRKLAELLSRVHTATTSPFLNDFEIVYLSNLSNDEAADLICQGHAEAGQVQVGKQLVDQIRTLTGNHPFLIQTVCARLFQTDGTLRALQADDLELDLQLQSFCEIEYAILSPTERLILQALAGRRPRKARALATAVNLSVTELNNFLTALERLGSIKKSAEGDYAISNVFVQTWLAARPAHRPDTVLVDDQISGEVANLARSKISTRRKKTKLQRELSFEKLEGAIVRIFDETSRPIGVGILVMEKQILTCAHVVAAALGLRHFSDLPPAGEVRLDFPLAATAGSFTAHVTAWQPPTPREGGDIAILDLVETPPGTQPVELRPAPGPWGHKFRAFGFPDNIDNGVWAEGRLLHFVGGGRLQVEGIHATGHFIQQGFSGGPVWDEELGDPIGIIVSVERAPNIRVAFVIPHNLLAQILPK